MGQLQSFLVPVFHIIKKKLESVKINMNIYGDEWKAFIKY